MNRIRFRSHISFSTRVAVLLLDLHDDGMNWKVKDFFLSKSRTKQKYRFNRNHMQNYSLQSASMVLTSTKRTGSGTGGVNLPSSARRFDRGDVWLEVAKLSTKFIAGLARVFGGLTNCRLIRAISSESIFSTTIEHGGQPNASHKNPTLLLPRVDSVQKILFLYILIEKKYLKEITIFFSIFTFIHVAFTLLIDWNGTQKSNENRFILT